ncbi:MAG TPA: peptidogalycan biosysnthesis protein [Anaerolineales bacterium]|nr:peptidogalycan biosysnthesis protein [Anaerolineales bacterium]
MTSNLTANLTIQTAQSINEIDRQTWNALSTGLPFQSHRWYQFGERVMYDCKPTYLLAYHQNELIGRAVLWKISSEPLPLSPGIGRTITETTLRRRPLLICRSPLSNASGLILPKNSLRVETRNALSEIALQTSRQGNCLALVFDFLDEGDSQGWEGDFVPVQLSDPGTVMHSRWASLEEFLESGNKKDRQHFKRTLREAEKLGITIEKHSKVNDVEAALKLIRNVERHYKNSPNPWMRSLLENLEQVQGTWLEAKQNGILVGCGALLDDNEAQLTTALGLAENIPYVYLLLTYASLEDAFQKKLPVLRWGSGAYDVKKSLGFELEENNHIVVSSTSLIIRTLIRSLR